MAASGLLEKRLEKRVVSVLSVSGEGWCAMATINRIGRVSVVEKSGRLYLRASIPLGGRKQSTWVTLGLDATVEGLGVARLKAKELDLDLEKVSMGVVFPYQKWRLSSDTVGAGSVSRELATLRQRLGIQTKHQHQQNEHGSQVKDSSVHNDVHDCDPGNNPINCFERLKKAWRDFEADRAEHWQTTTRYMYRLLGGQYFKLLSTVESTALQQGIDLYSPSQVNELLLSLVKQSYSHRRALYLIEKINLSLTYAPDYPPLSSPRRIKTRKTVTPEVTSFTLSERDRILDYYGVYNLDVTAARKRDYLHRLMGCLVAFCFYSGARVGEATGLGRKDIDLDGRLIHFHQRRVFTEKGLTLDEGLKTQHHRYFPINDQLMDILGRTLVLTGRFNPSSDLVFPNTMGKLIASGTLYRLWKQMFAELGLPYRPPTTMRHTFITQCLAKGVPVATVAKWSGNSPKVIYQHYAAPVEQDVPDF